ncbi:MAG: 4-hydroxy-tetrahydrodipicolinate reductase [Candidatus Latescibacteria bacterium]|jgi:4-hydroxy-tetrahydrodipicolinate reductase|nr:4-hydroxy-tetrahydrodipicolinate reductase [Candidatus Latescibacterota bacterium]MBT7369878.1 4-hydroxy-tetrahydrodipicolinate reductase [Gammaproteobacteria bacterium]
MIAITLSGVAGRMGVAIGRAVATSDDIRVAGALGPPNRPYTGHDLGEQLGTGTQGIVIEGNVGSVLQPGRTWVEFSTPKASIAHAEQVSDMGLPLLIGTTGFTDSQVEVIRKYSEHIPCLVGSNMSLGANLLFLLTEYAARLVDADADIEIIESHHRFKRDAPSGTAKDLTESILRGRRQVYKAVYGRAPSSGPRTNREIGIHSIRAGDISGEHTVLFGSIGERIELTHRVQSVDTFAHGTLHAIRFLQDRPAGLYTMMDVIRSTMNVSTD